MDERLIGAWIALYRAAEGSHEHQEHVWAHGAISDLVEERPEEAWPLILEILRREERESVLAALAAGPLEELLSYHGPAFIERVEAESRRDRRFRWLLGGVWQLLMSDDIWARVKAAAPERW